MLERADLRFQGNRFRTTSCMVCTETRHGSNEERIPMTLTDNYLNSDSRISRLFMSDSFVVTSIIRKCKEYYHVPCVLHKVHIGTHSLVVKHIKCDRFTSMCYGLFHYCYTT